MTILPTLFEARLGKKGRILAPGGEIRDARVVCGRPGCAGELGYWVADNEPEPWYTLLLPAGYGVNTEFDAYVPSGRELTRAAKFGPANKAVLESLSAPIDVECQQPRCRAMNEVSRASFLRYEPELRFFPGPIIENGLQGRSVLVPRRSATRQPE